MTQNGSLNSIEGNHVRAVECGVGLITPVNGIMQRGHGSQLRLCFLGSRDVGLDHVTC